MLAVFGILGKTSAPGFFGHSEKITDKQNAITFCILLLSPWNKQYPQMYKLLNSIFTRSNNFDGVYKRKWVKIFDTYNYYKNRGVQDQVTVVKFIIAAGKIVFGAWLAWDPSHLVILLLQNFDIYLIFYFYKLWFFVITCIYVDTHMYICRDIYYSKEV